MGTSSKINGQINAQRSLTEQEMQILTDALDSSDNRHFFNNSGRAGTHGELNVSTDDARDYGITPIDQHWRDYRNAGQHGIDFAEFLVSFINLKGLEDLVWDGEFDLAKDNNTIPEISRVAVTRNQVTRQVAQVVFGEPQAVTG